MARETFSYDLVQLATSMPIETPVFHALGEGVAVQDQLRKNDTNSSLHDFIFVETRIEKQALAGTGFVDLSTEELKRKRQRNRGEQASVGTLQSDVTEVLTRSKTRRAINGMNIDSWHMVNELEAGIWEPDNPNITCEEEDLECLNPKEGEPDMYEDDESRVFHEKDFRYEMSRDPDVVVQEHDTLMQYIKTCQKLTICCENCLTG